VDGKGVYKQNFLGSWCIFKWLRVVKQKIGGLARYVVIDNCCGSLL
jgi:hypothetical protein